MAPSLVFYTRSLQQLWRYLIPRMHFLDLLLEVIPLSGPPHTLLHSRAVHCAVQLVGHLQHFSLDVTVTQLAGGQVWLLHKSATYLNLCGLAQTPLQSCFNSLWVKVMT